MIFEHNLNWLIRMVIYFSIQERLNVLSYVSMWCSCFEVYNAKISKDSYTYRRANYFIEFTRTKIINCFT